MDKNPESNMTKPTNAIETIEITNFGGRLTRQLNGDLNSGFAKFVQSSGYDPFSKPGNLTWLESPVDITGNVTDLILAAKPRTEGVAPALQYIYAVGHTGNLYKITPNTANTPNVDTASVIGKLTANSPTFTFGASMDFYQSASSVAGSYTKIYVGSNNQVNAVALDGSGDTFIGSAGYKGNSFRPLKQFVGKLLFGNGNTIGAIDATGTVTSSVIGTGQGNLYSELSPALPVEAIVHDMDISPDGNYLLVTASNIPNEVVSNSTNSPDRQSAASSDGAIFSWNGVDAAITASKTIPSYAVTALQTYLDKNFFFSNDAFGASLNDGTNKLLTLPNNKSPLPNSILVNGNFICWIAPESDAFGRLFASMYYFGSLDQDNPPGLYRVMRQFSASGVTGFITQTPMHILTNNKYTTLNTSKSSIVTAGYGKHYFSTLDVSVSADTYKLMRFLITPTGTGTLPAGAYETQTQLFSKKITVKQIRVYTEPTVTGNSFIINCVGSDGATITNGTFTYTFAAGTDPTKLQGALERIDFNPAMKDTYALAINISQNGTTNFTIKKIEVDWAYSGK